MTENVRDNKSLNRFELDVDGTMPADNPFAESPDQVGCLQHRRA